MKEKKYENYLISGLDGGSFFSAAILVNLLFTLVVSLILTLGGAADKNFTSSYDYTYMCYLISPAAILVTLVYAKIKCKLNVRAACGFNSFDKKFLLITALLFGGCVLGLSGVNELFVGALDRLVGYEAPTPNIPDSGAGYFLLSTLIICVLPAFFEETLFRGLILNGAKRLGDAFAALTTGLLFCLFHRSPNQTPYQFILGAIFGLLAVRSGSILPSMIFHFLNNFYIIVCYYIWGANVKIPVAINVVMIVAGLALLAAGLYLLIKSKKPQKEEEIKTKYLEIAGLKQERAAFMISSAVGGVVCLILWISELVTYVS